MKFIVGLATGIVLGAAGAVAYSVKSGQDLRGVYESVRSDIEKGDFDALGARLESGFAELQAVLEVRMAQVRESTAAAIEEATKAIDEARAQASEAGTTASDVVVDTADDVQETLEVVADESADGVEDVIVAIEERTEA